MSLMGPQVIDVAVAVIWRETKEIFAHEDVVRRSGQIYISTFTYSTGSLLVLAIGFTGVGKVSSPMPALYVSLLLVNSMQICGSR